MTLKYSHNREAAAHRFFIGIARQVRENRRDTETLPLFSLALIMDAEGYLANDVRWSLRLDRGLRK